jgi:hypothetical protein
MRRFPAVVLALALGLPAAADDRPRTHVVVPVEPREHQRLHFFGRRHRRLVPGTVSINRAPYVCDVDRARFADGDAFATHLRTAHRVPPERIPEVLLFVDGRVHFAGE